MLRVLYAGSPDASALTLKNLVEKSKKISDTPNFEIVGVLTNPPSAQGRHKTPVPTPVESIAREFGIPVFSPETLNQDARADILKINPDILVCFAYGRIFGPKFMSLFRFGGINLHPSALPEYRGCSPINAAILDMKDCTAFLIQKISQKMDEGNILCQEKILLSKKETAFSLLNDAAIWGAEKITELLKEISETQKVPEGKAQEGVATYTGMIKKEDAKIDWNKDAFQIDAIVRAYNPEPTAWTVENGIPLKIIEGFPVSDEEAKAIFPDANLFMENIKIPGKVVGFAKSKGILVSCKKGFFFITKLQRQGKNPMGHKDFMNGARNFIGTVLS